LKGIHARSVNVTEAFTVRMRSTAGSHALWLAPAGGMGLSFPCCTYGHDGRDAAFLCGMKRLEQKLLSPLTPASESSAA
jgi:hypothetical protein